MGTNRVFMSLGFGFGPLLGGFFVEGLKQTFLTLSPLHSFNNYQYLFILNGFLFILPLVLGLMLYPAFHPRKASAEFVPTYFE